MNSNNFAFMCGFYKRINRLAEEDRARLVAQFDDWRPLNQGNEFTHGEVVGGLVYHAVELVYALANKLRLLSLDCIPLFACATTGRCLAHSYPTQEEMQWQVVAAEVKNVKVIPIKKRTTKRRRTPNSVRSR